MTNLLGRDSFLTAHRIEGYHCPLTSNNANKRGMASISFDFSSVAICPRVRLASAAPALTKCQKRNGEEPPPQGRR